MYKISFNKKLTEQLDLKVLDINEVLFKEMKSNGEYIIISGISHSICDELLNICTQFMPNLVSSTYSQYITNGNYSNVLGTVCSSDNKNISIGICQAPEVIKFLHTKDNSFPCDYLKNILTIVLLNINSIHLRSGYIDSISRSLLTDYMNSLNMNEFICSEYIPKFTKYNMILFHNENAQSVLSVLNAIYNFVSSGRELTKKNDKHKLFKHDDDYKTYNKLDTRSKTYEHNKFLITGFGQIKYYMKMRYNDDIKQLIRKCIKLYLEKEVCDDIPDECIVDDLVESYRLLCCHLAWNINGCKSKQAQEEFLNSPLCNK